VVESASIAKLALLEIARPVGVITVSSITRAPRRLLAIGVLMADVVLESCTEYLESLCGWQIWYAVTKIITIRLFVTHKLMLG